MYVAVVHSVLKIKKISNKRNTHTDSLTTGFETSPLQRRKREGHTIDVLQWRFDKHGDSRQIKRHVKILVVFRAIPLFISHCEVKKGNIT